jgi:hypothetical protein
MRGDPSGKKKPRVALQFRRRSVRPARRLSTNEQMLFDRAVIENTELRAKAIDLILQIHALKVIEVDEVSNPRRPHRG